MNIRLKKLKSTLVLSILLVNGYAQNITKLSNERVYIHSNAVLKDKIFFSGYTESTGKELWYSDGTSENPKMLLDIVPGDVSSSPSEFGTFGNQIYFLGNGNSDSDDKSVFYTDGTEQGTVSIKNFKNPEDKIVFKAELFCQAIVNRGYFIFRVDGTSENAQLASERIEQNYIDDSYFAEKELTFKFYTLNGSLYLNQRSGLLKYNEESKKFDKIIDYRLIIDSKLPSLVKLADNFLYLFYETGEDRTDFYSYNLSNQKLQKLATFAKAESFLKFVKFYSKGDNLFFSANDGVHGYEPWVSDGSPIGTKMLYDLNPGEGSSYPPYYSTFFAGNTIVFSAYEKFGVKTYLYRYDFESNSIGKLKDNRGRPLNSFAFTGTTELNKWLCINALVYTNEPDSLDENYYNYEYIQENIIEERFILDGINGDIFEVDKSEIVALNYLELVRGILFEKKGSKIYDIHLSHEGIEVNEADLGIILWSLDLSNGESKSEFYFPKEVLNSLQPNGIGRTYTYDGYAFFQNNFLVTTSGGLYMASSCEDNTQINPNQVFETCSNTPLSFETEYDSPTWYSMKSSHISKIIEGKSFESKFSKNTALYLERQDSKGCRSIDKRLITVNGPESELKVQIIGNDKFCGGSSIELKASVFIGHNANSYKWLLNSNELSNDNDKTLIIETPGVYTVEIENEYGCKATSEPKEIIEFSPSSVTISSSTGTLLKPYEKTILEVPYSYENRYYWYKDDVLIDGEYVNTYETNEPGVYKVEIVSEGCRFFTSEISLDLITSLGNIREIKIHPNPTSQYLVIPSLTSTSEVNLYTISGQKVKSKIKYNNRQLDVGHLSPGTYILNIISSQKGVKNFKFVKN